MITTIFSLLATITSCEFIEMSKSENINYQTLPKWTISINEIIKYPRASREEKEVPTFSGRTVWLNKYSEINSKSIISITIVPNKGKFDYCNLKVKLNTHGSTVAMRLCNDITHTPWAFLVDGVYYRSVKFNEPPLADDYSEIIIKGPFDKTLALLLQKYSVPNYKHYNHG